MLQLLRADSHTGEATRGSDLPLNTAEAIQDKNIRIPEEIDTYFEILSNVQLLGEGGEFVLSAEMVLQQIIELPLMDNRGRMSFCCVLPKLSQRIGHYLTVCEKMGEPPIFTRSVILNQLYEIFKVIMFKWLQKSDIKLKQAVLRSATCICVCLRAEDLQDIFPRVKSSLLEEYRAGLEPAYITQFIAWLGKAVADEQWSNKIIEDIKRELYEACCSSQQEQAFLFKFYGAILQFSSWTSFVTVQLHWLVRRANHGRSEEREGVAAAVGIAARDHHTEAMAFIYEFAMSVVSKKTFNEVNIFKECVDLARLYKECTVMLCLGQVASQAKDVRIVAGDILKNLILFLNKGSKFPDVELAFLKSTNIIFNAICKGEEGCPITFPQKEEMFQILTVIIDDELLGRTLKTSMCRDAMLGIIALCKMRPHTLDYQKSELLRPAVQFMCSLLPGGSNNLYTETVAAFDNMLKALMGVSFDIIELERVLEFMEPFLVIINSRKRENCLEIGKKLMEWSVYQLRPNIEDVNHHIFHYIGLALPHLSDPKSKIRQNAFEFCYYGLQVHAGLEGLHVVQKKELMCTLRKIRSDCLSDGEGFNAAGPQIAELLCAHCSPDQIGKFCLTLLETQPGPSISGSQAAGAMLYATILRHVDGLASKVQELVDKVHERLPSIKNEVVQEHMMGVVSLIAVRHTKHFLSSLLEFQEPLDDSGKQICMTIILEKIDPTLFLPLILDQLGKPFDDIDSHPFMATELLQLLLPKFQFEGTVIEYFVETFNKLLHFVTNCVVLHAVDSPFGKQLSVPVRFAVEAIKSCLTGAGYHSEVDELERNGAWNQIKNYNSYLDGVSQLAQVIFKSENRNKLVIMESLKEKLDSKDPSDSLFSSAFFVEAVDTASDMNVQLSHLMNIFMAHTKNECTSLRLVGLSGLVCLAKHHRQLVPEMVTHFHKHVPEIQDDVLLSEIWKTVTLIASKQTGDFVNTILKLPQPLDSVYSRMCKCLISEAISPKEFIPFFLKEFDEPAADSETNPSMAAEILQQLLPDPKFTSAVIGFFPAIFIKLGLFITKAIAINNLDAANAGEQQSVTVRCAINTMKTAMSAAGFQVEVMRLETNEAWQQLLNYGEFHEGFTKLSCAIISAENRLKMSIMDDLEPMLNSNCPEAVLFSSKFFLEVTKATLYFNYPLCHFLETFLENIAHECADINLVGLRGLEYIAEELPPKTEHFQRIMAKMPVIIGLLKNTDEKVVMEAMKIISLLLKKSPKKEARNVCEAVAEHTSIFFDHKSMELRKRAIYVFCQIMPLVTRDNFNTIRTQVMRGLVPLNMNTYMQDPMLAEVALDAIKECERLFKLRGSAKRKLFMPFGIVNHKPHERQLFERAKHMAKCLAEANSS